MAASAATHWGITPLRIGESNVRCLSAAPGKASSSQVASPAEVYRSPGAPGSPQPSERCTAAAQALPRPERTAQKARVRSSCSYLAATNFFKLTLGCHRIQAKRAIEINFSGGDVRKGSIASVLRCPRYVRFDVAAVSSGKSECARKAAASCCIAVLERKSDTIPRKFALAG